MNVQNTPQTAGSYYKTLMALRKTYQPDDDSGIPKLSESTSQAAVWSHDNNFADLPPQQKNTN